MEFFEEFYLASYLANQIANGKNGCINNRLKMNEESMTSVKYPLSVDTKFQKIALKLGRNKRTVFIQMVDYFYRSKKDPLDLNDELLKNTLLKNHKEYIGFIKTQESDLLIPMKRDMRAVHESQSKINIAFDQYILKHNKETLRAQQILLNKSQEAEKVLVMVYKQMKSVQDAKKQFMEVFEGYIKAREGFGIMSSSKDKEDLIKATKLKIIEL